MTNDSKKVNTFENSDTETLDQDKLLEAIELLENSLNNMEANYQNDRKELLTALGMEKPEKNDPLQGVFDQLTPEEIVEIENEAGAHSQSMDNMMKEMIIEGDSTFAKKLKSKFIKYGVIVGLAVGGWFYYNSQGEKSNEEQLPQTEQTQDEENPIQTAEQVKVREEIVKIEKIDIKEKSFVRNQQLFESLSDNCKRIYLFNELAGRKEAYIIADKPSATLMIFDQNNNLVAQFPAIFGAVPGEAPNRYDLNDPNRAINRKEKGVATTPMGTYEFGVKDSRPRKDIIEMYGGDIFEIFGMVNMAIHSTYPKEKEVREKALNSPTPEDNKMSGGCINISRENLDKILPMFAGRKDNKLYITPDNKTVVFSPQY